MHAVNEKDGVIIRWRGRRDCMLSCGKALSYDSTAVYTASARRMP